MKKIFTIVVVAPVLALFLGIGVLALNIADTWDERNTDVLISNLSLVCVFGGLAVTFVLATLIGLAIYSRWQQHRRWSLGSRGHNEVRTINSVPSYRPWTDAPPALPAAPEVKGRLYSPGPHGYEDLDNTLFGNSPTDDSDWR